MNLYSILLYTLYL